MRLKDYSPEKQALLAAWWALADAEAPTTREFLPLDHSRALNEFSAMFPDKYPITTARPFRSPVRVSNHNRQVRARKGIGALAS